MIFALLVLESPFTQTDATDCNKKNYIAVKDINIKSLLIRYTPGRGFLGYERLSIGCNSYKIQLMPLRIINNLSALNQRSPLKYLFHDTKTLSVKRKFYEFFCKVVVKYLTFVQFFSFLFWTHPLIVYALSRKKMKTYVKFFAF